MVISTEEFALQISQAKIGARIQLCSLDAHTLQHTQAWYGHPKGIVLQQGRFLLLNDEDWGPDMRNAPISEEPYIKCCFASPQGGVVMSSDGPLRLDGTEQINETEAHQPFKVPASITRKSGKIFLAGTDADDGIEITEGP